MKHFPSQAGKAWFTGDLFRAVARLRGMEAAAPEALAEAFYARKLQY
ncbi:MAG TPA: PIG-L family deacetylase, partial [Vicinamibacteria bacterium]|nr:PIG-L family deacetylase [Vicinamibacteria bacterium]